MPEELARKIAESAEVVVNGYAFVRHELGLQVVNLDTGNATVFSPSDEMLETSMPDIELAIALRYLKANKQYLAG